MTSAQVRSRGAPTVSDNASTDLKLEAPDWYAAYMAELAGEEWPT